MRPKSNDKHSSKRQKKRSHAKGDRHVKMEAEITVVQPLTKQPLDPKRLQEAQKDSSLRDSWGSSVLPTLIADFWLSEKRKINFFFFQTIKFMIVWQDSIKKLIQLVKRRLLTWKHIDTRNGFQRQIKVTYAKDPFSLLFE